MSDQLDLSLPPKAPSMAHYHHQPTSLRPAVLYTLVDLNDAELADLERECEAGCINTGGERGTCVRLAPHPRFVGQPLRAVFDHHLELGTQNTFDPRYFIAVVEKAWQTRGVILVTLDDDKLDCNVDSFRIKAFDSGLTLANLQISNSSWEEEKETYEFHPDEEDVADTDPNDSNEGDDDDDGGPQPPTQNIPLGYYIPIYIHSSLSENEVTEKLEPGYKHKSPADFACRIQAKLTTSSSKLDSTTTTTTTTTTTNELIKQAAALHPLRCAKNRYLHKVFILVIDTPDPVEYGMLMVKLPPWESSGSGEELSLATLENIRIPYTCHEGLQARFLILANGDAEWPSHYVRAQPVFVVFQYNTHGKELSFGAGLIDAGAAKRNPGEERLVYAPELIKRPGQGLERIAWNYDEAVRRFPWFCAEKRFVEGLDKTYFICVDRDDVAKKGVALVRRNWDGSVWGRSRDELLGLPINDISTVRVPIKEALNLLEKGKEGQTDGMSDSLKEFFR